MFGQPVGSMIEPGKLVVASPDASVSSAAGLMKQARVGALLVVEEGQLVGIFTERDALFRVIASGRDPQATLLADVMTRNPKTIEPDETFGYALLLMHDCGFRHVPVIEDGHPIGIVSARSALDPDLEEFTAETARREAIRRRA